MAVKPAQIVVELVAIETLGVSNELIVIVRLLLVAVRGEAHCALLVITTLTTSPLASVVLENVELLVPTFEPFTFHWYDGLVPPFVGFAVKVTFTPEHAVVPGLALIETDGVVVGTLVTRYLTVSVALSQQPAVARSTTNMMVSTGGVILLEAV